MNRIFSHSSGRLCSVAVDHFIGYGHGLPDGLRQIQPTLAAIVAGRPDAVTMHKGIAASAWPPYAGRVPLILQSTTARPDETAREQMATPEDAVRLGADGFAVSAFVRGATEAEHLRIVADCVREAARFEIPVICHIYPRDKENRISFAAEDIAWAVRCALEVGADVVKTPYCGDVQAYAQIVADCPVPVVAAGGPKADTLPAAQRMIAEVVRSGARGATIGRNVWGFAPITTAVHAFKAVIHDGKTPEQAAGIAGLG
jgi:class I fructose-bisphosphate aldolase